MRASAARFWSMRALAPPELAGCVLVIQSDPSAEGFYRVRGAQRVGERESASVAGRWLPLLELVLAQSTFRESSSP